VTAKKKKKKHEKKKGEEEEVKKALEIGSVGGDNCGARHSQKSSI
jgi:hypothetical protein